MDSIAIKAVTPAGLTRLHTGKYSKCSFERNPKINLHINRLLNKRFHFQKMITSVYFFIIGIFVVSIIFIFKC